MANSTFSPLLFPGAKQVTGEDLNRVQAAIDAAMRRLAAGGNSDGVTKLKSKDGSVIITPSSGTGSVDLSASALADAGTGSSTLSLGSNAPFVSPSSSNKYLKITIDGTDYLIPAWTMASIPSGPPLSGLLLWVKGDAGITLDGSSNVSLWADQSGAGNDLTQSTSSLRAPMATTSVAGVPAVSFGNSNNCLENALVAAGGNVSVAVVARRGTGSSGSAFPRIVDWYYSSQNRLIAVSQTPAFYYASSGSTLNFDATTAGGICTPLLTVDSGTATSYQNDYTTPIATLSEAGSANTGIRIGGAPGTSQGANADCPEFLVWDHALDAAERTQLQSYFHTRGYM